MKLNKGAESVGTFNTPNMGIAGEVRCVVTKADGTITTDTGYHKNLILNQGLDFFGGLNGGAINTTCVIGSGNSAPAVTQTKLDVFVALTDGVDATSSYEYVDKGDNLYRMWEQKRYRFTGLANVNISEVGLASQGTTSVNYYLTTRALIKDAQGAPTSISILSGETLDIYYKIHKVVSTSDSHYEFNLLDGSGGSVAYNAVVRPIMVGTSVWRDITGVATQFNRIWSLKFNFTNQDLSLLTYRPEEDQSVFGTVLGSAGDYTPGTTKIVLTFSLSLNQGNTNIRVFSLMNGSEGVAYPFFPFQIRFGRVSDDAPITKTANDTLTIPLEISWGRYEGAL